MEYILQVFLVNITIMLQETKRVPDNEYHRDDMQPDFLFLRNVLSTGLE